MPAFLVIFISTSSVSVAVFTENIWLKADLRNPPESICLLGAGSSVGHGVLQ